MSHLPHQVLQKRHISQYLQKPTAPVGLQYGEVGLINITVVLQSNSDTDM